MMKKEKTRKNCFNEGKKKKAHCIIPTCATALM